MDNFLLDINEYYTNKLKQFGNTPLGVDWRDESSQLLRFEQLSKVITKDNFSILDYGCGYGALYTYLEKLGKSFSYTGFDISQEMITVAADNLSGEEHVFFTANELLLKPCNYVLASGIFNVRLKVSDAVWETYIYETLKKINSLSIDGFSFNLLPVYADPDLKKGYLYYAEPAWVENVCKKITTGKISVLEKYGLFEFTVLISK